ncbi:MAG: hypothetical protein ACXW1Z_25170 [Methylobacter sp.]
MGGYGSGRKFGADCTDNYRSIDVRCWQRDGYLVPGQQLDWQWSQNGKKVAAITVKVKVSQLRLIYNYRSNRADWESLDYPVGLQTTACHYGGVRYWFTCPAVGCGRRVAVLYLGGKIFACRHCYKLVYQSQRETKSDRGYRGAGKVRTKLVWSQGIINPPGDKPKGMHWKTYYRLFFKHTKYSNDAYTGTLATLDKLDSRFAKIQR